MIGKMFLPLGFDKLRASQLLTGIFELSSGVNSLKNMPGSGSLAGSVAMAAFMLGWAGISIHFQTMSFICGSGLSSKPYILGKLLHGIISSVLVLIFRKLVPSFFASAITSSLSPVSPNTGTSLILATASQLSPLVIGTISTCTATVIGTIFHFSARSGNNRKPA